LLTRAQIEQLLAESQDRLFEWPHTFVTSTWHGMPPADQQLRAHLAPAIRDALCEIPWTSTRGRPPGPVCVAA